LGFAVDFAAVAGFEGFDFDAAGALIALGEV